MSNNQIPLTVLKKGNTTFDSVAHPINSADIAAVYPIDPSNPDGGSGYKIVLANADSGRAHNERTWEVVESPGDILAVADSYHVEEPLVQVTCSKIDTMTVSQNVLVNLRYCKVVPFGDGSKIFSNPHGKHSTTTYVVEESPEDLTIETGGSST